MRGEIIKPTGSNKWDATVGEDGWFVIIQDKV